MIVTGIRLFNKECGKGGEGIDDCELNIYLYLIQNAFILSFENILVPSLQEGINDCELTNYICC